MRGRAVVAALAAALAVAGCDSAGSGSSETPPVTVGFTAVELPAGATPATLTALGDALLVGVRAAGRPGLLRLDRDGAVAELPVNGVTPYGLEATWRAVAVDGDRLLALGGERGGAHGNVRWSVWTGSATDGITEQRQGFSTFGGWGAGDLVGVVLTPAVAAVVGAWQSADTGFDVAVWTPDGDSWVRQSSAGTALESRRGALGFPMAAAALGNGVLVAGWQLADGRQQPTVWRSGSGTTGWTATALPDAGRAGSAVALRCWDPGSGAAECAATGWVDGALAVWRLADGKWTRLSGLPAITVGDRDRMAAPIELDGRLAVVVSDGGRLKLALADGDRWTVRELAGPTGAVTAVEAAGGAVQLVAGPDENAQRLWRAELASIR